MSAWQALSALSSLSVSRKPSQMDFLRSLNPRLRLILALFYSVSTALATSPDALALTALSALLLLVIARPAGRFDRMPEQCIRTVLLADDQRMHTP